MTTNRLSGSPWRAAPAVVAVAALLVAGSSAATADPQTASPQTASPQTTPQTASPQSTDDPCPEPFPIEELEEGMEATGLTVEQGTEAEEFSATVVGVIENGVGPDVDMIMVETDSPAIERAGGVWSGMSGSPVYASDGRLIGAIAYGMSQSPSPIAGLTPAADMQKLLDQPGATHTTPQPRDDVALPVDIQRQLVANGALTTADARAGMSGLALPMAVSGLSADRLDEFSGRLDKRSLDVHAYPAGAVDADETGDPADIFPGSNFAAGISYGDVTAAAVGTTTTVCADQAVAFGHPFQWTGPAALSLHSASAVFVQRDDAFGSFKVANPQGVVGTVDEDRQAGIRGLLGEAPPVTPITATVSSEGNSRTGTTNVTTPGFVADTAVLHLWANFDTVLDRIGAGTADLTWVITGKRASGEPFEVAVENKYASQDDIAYEAGFDSFDQLWSIFNNEYEDAEVTGVDYTADVANDFTQYTVSKFEVKQPDGSFETPSDSTPLPVPAGSQVHIRVNLKPHKSAGSAMSVELALNIPDDAAGRYGWVDVTGGRADGGDEEWDEEPSDDAPASAADFDQLLDDLRSLVPNNSVTAALTFDDSDDAQAAELSRESVDHVVVGSRGFPVEVVEP